ncbi:hypothetical protein EVAR_67397_1 [Eumeta japonica]|uniref:Uncharacterized protein n=1 Tax=Eumeta variegata TaxID=151549 RepID=A0A4C1ZUV9_EUMVA|nr:hypothetical protein EVAR_67397_1 [Eumeta japonica]
MSAARDRWSPASIDTKKFKRVTIALLVFRVGRLSNGRQIDLPKIYLSVEESSVHLSIEKIYQNSDPLNETRHVTSSLGSRRVLRLISRFSDMQSMSMRNELI